MKPIIYLEKREVYEYPQNNRLYHPSCKYPEYPFSKAEISESENAVYDMVRLSFYGLQLDEKNFGTASWNPFGDVIKPGDVVLIKPNMVNNYETQSQYDCTLTHPSIVRAAIDYCIIAKAGQIILGDAPIQGADMDKIRNSCHYDEIIRFYQSKQINVVWKDFRNLIVNSERGMLKPLKQGANSSDIVTVDLGKHSKHYTDSGKHSYGICGYTDESINRNHCDKTGRHIYAVAQTMLDADVIINLPKPKTHRFAGITGAQKNFVGICPDKETLPHYKSGTKCCGGDESNKNTVLSKIISGTYKKYLKSCKEEQYKFANFYYFIYACCGKAKSKMLFTHGAWYGNDTIWRTIIDLNKIVFYCRKDGVLDFSKKQRLVFTIGDMIIAGENDGPLHPDSKKLGIILSSHNCAVFDALFCKITGFDKENIPTVRHSLKNTWLCPWKEEDIIVYSNCSEFNRKVINKITFPASFHFQPHPYWRDIL